MTDERLPDRVSRLPRPRWGWVAASAVVYLGSVGATVKGVLAGLGELELLYGKLRPTARYDAAHAFLAWQLLALPLAALAIVLAARGGRLRFLPLGYGLLALAALAAITVKLVTG